jgi:small conductance mechanosensitive channel
MRSQQREEGGMERIQGFLNEIGWQDRLVGLGRIVLILVVAWAARLALRKAMDRLEERLLRRSAPDDTPTESAKRVSTIMKLVRQSVSIAFWGTVSLVVLGELGVDIGPILAGAGILGLAVGFGAQNLVRDIISGLFMLLEDQIRVGDVAVINGTGGFVEQVNFRTVVLRDLGGVVHVFPNGGITSLSNMTHDWSAYVFEIGVAYKEDTDRVVEVMEEVGAEMRADDYFGRLILEDLEVFGVDKFDSSSVVIKARLKTKPVKQWEVGRQYLRRLKHAFDDRDIEIPFPHQSLYFGEASRPIELKLVGGGGELAAAAE